MSVGERIKKRRKQLKLSADQMAEKLGKNRATIYRYESSEIENMPIEIIKPLANVLQVTPAYLMGWEDEKDVPKPSSTYTYLPIDISAGIPINMEGIEQPETINLPDSVMGKWAGQQDIVISRINGNSMNKTMPDRSLIAVKPTALENLKDGDIVVYSDSYNYAVKRMYWHDDHVIFRPHSTDTSFIDNKVSVENTELKIHGKVVVYIVEMD